MTDRIFEAFAPVYWAAGLPVIPLRERNKMPDIKEWSAFGTRMPNLSEQTQWLARFPEGNIGLPFGVASGLCAIDIDTEDAALTRVIMETCGPTPWVRIGRKGMGLVYRWEGQKNFKLRGADGMICEFLGQGNQMVLPPSIHPDTQQPYTANANLWEVLDQIPLLGRDIETRLRVALCDVGAMTAQQAQSHRPLSVQVLDLPGNRYARWLGQRLAEAEERLAPTLESSRNDTLFKVAIDLAKDVAAAGADWSVFAARLAQVASRIGLGERETEGTLASAWKSGSEEPTAWITLSQSWIYVVGADHFLHLESMTTSKPGAFRTEFDRLTPGKEKNIARFLTVNDYIVKVQGLSYAPETQDRFFEQGGRKWLNTYTSPNIVAEEGDWSPLVEYLEYLLPDEASRTHIIKMLAHLVRCPGEKITHALMLCSSQHGIGKSTLIDILGQQIGASNWRKATNDELNEKYQGYLENNLVVLVEELNLGQGLAIYNKLKDMITTLKSPMRRLYEEARQIDNRVTFVFLSNMEKPILLEQNDRRFLVEKIPARVKLGDDYWTRFHEWWRSSPGIIRAFFDQVDLTDFNRFAPPPMTSAKQALIHNSKSTAAQDLMELIEAREAPFRVDLVTRHQVYEALVRHDRQLKRSSIDGALREIGAVNLGQIRLPEAKHRGRFQFDVPSRPTVWAIRNVAFWQASSPQCLVEEFLADEGRLAEFDVMPFGFGLLPASSQMTEEARQILGSKTGRQILERDEFKA